MDRGVSWFMLNNNGGNIKSDALAHSHRQMPSSSGIWFHKLCWSVMSHWDLCVSFILKTQKIENTFVFVIFYPSLMAANTFLCVSVGYYIFFLVFFAPLQEECVLSDPQGESDADADIEDTDCRSPTRSYSHSVLRCALLYLTLCLWLNLFRLQEPGSLQRISSRRRKRPRVARQDTTESEDDGGRSHRSHRWNLRLSPDRAHSRTILEVRRNKKKQIKIKQSRCDCGADLQL